MNLNQNIWIKGPIWSKDSPVSCFVGELKCLSATDKKFVRTEVHCSVAVLKNKSVVNLEKFSKLSKVLRIVTLIFRFLNQLKHPDSDPEYVTKVYLIKWAQKQH